MIIQYFESFLGLKIHWDYNFILETLVTKNTFIATIDELLLKWDCIDAWNMNGMRGQTIFSFALDKTFSFEKFCELETTQYEKVQNYVLNNITLSLLDAQRKKISGEAFTFTIP